MGLMPFCFADRSKIIAALLNGKNVLEDPEALSIGVQGFKEETKCGIFHAVPDQDQRVQPHAIFNVLRCPSVPEISITEVGTGQDEIARRKRENVVTDPPVQMHDAIVIGATRLGDGLARVTQRIGDAGRLGCPLEQCIEVRCQEPWPPIAVAGELKQGEVMARFNSVLSREQLSGGGAHMGRHFR